MRIEELGNKYGSHVVIADNLDSNSIVYSCGVGDDASFDLEIIDKYGCDVWAFDPTIKSIEWVASQRWPEQFNFVPWGVIGKDKEIPFYKPYNPEHVSHSVLDRGTENFLVQMYSLDTISFILKHKKIDVLKLDIEGAEYDIIEHFPSIPIEQITLEFHHFFPNVSIEETAGAVEKILSMGYQIFHKSSNGHHWGFVKCLPTN